MTLNSRYRYVTLNSTNITFMIETGFAYLRNMLAKVQVTVKEEGEGEGEGE